MLVTIRIISIVVTDHSKNRHGVLVDFTFMNLPKPGILDLITVSYYLGIWIARSEYPGHPGVNKSP